MQLAFPCPVCIFPCLPHPSPCLAGIPTPISIPPPPLLPLSPQTTYVAPSTHFSSASPLNINPVIFPWIRTTLSSSSPNQTTPSSSALSSVSNTISHPFCLTLSATLLSLQLFVSLTLNLLIFQVTTNNNAINPRMPAPNPNRPSLMSPLLFLSLLVSFLLLLSFPLLLTPLLVGPGWGWIPTKLSAISTPSVSPLHPPPQAPDQPQRDAPHTGPRRAPAFVWIRVGSRAASPSPHRSDGDLLERLVFRQEPGSSAVGRRSLCPDRGGGQYILPPTLAYPPAHRGGKT